MPLQTAPIPLGTIGDAPDEFRLVAQADILALLERLCEADATLHLGSPGGAGFSTTLWALDPARDVASFSVDPREPQLQRLLESQEITAVGYLDNVKLQFDLHGMVLVAGARASALNALIPREMFRFQRRASYRVRPVSRSAPTASLAHPMIPEMQLALRVLDVSLGGCSLFLPDDVPPIAAGVRINGVLIELDADTRLRAGLALHHITAIHPGTGGCRLGCEWVGLGGEAIRALQRFIDQVQKRRRLMSLQ